MDFFELIIRLEDELGDKRAGIFSKKVDVDVCRELVAEIRRSFPDVIREASIIVSEREKILAEAKAVYANSLSEADKRVDQIVSQSEVCQRAKEDAEQLVSLAEGRCQQIAHETKQHLDYIFGESEKTLQQALELIRRNRDELRTATILKKE